MKGEACDEVEVAVAAEKAWAVYGSHEIGRLLPKLLPNAIEKAEVEGDGGVGSTMKVFHTSNVAVPKYFKEEVVKVDHEKRVKETKHVEGGFLEAGFLSYVVRFQIMEKGSDACVVKTIIEYEIEEGSSVDISRLTATTAYTKLAEAVAKHLNS